jgi:molybdopterin converting factor small subunit
MTVRVVAFGRVRELLGWGERELVLGAAARTRDAWDALADEAAALRSMAGSTRVAVNGVLVAGDSRLSDGDELALLPPVGGG